MIKGPTSKYYIEHIYVHKEKKLELGREQENIISWYDDIEQVCNDSGGQQYVSTGWLPRIRPMRPLKKTPFGSDLLRVRTPSRHSGKDTHFASGDDWHVASERIRFELSTEMHCAVEIDTH